MPLRGRFLFAALAALAGACACAAAPCTDCHREVGRSKVVHAPLQTGCGTCHGDLDTATVPHRSSVPAAGAPPAARPQRCPDCHEAALFEGKFVHGALLAGPCELCHDPHGSAWQGLLKKDPVRLCLDCHPEVARRPHVVAGIGRRNHPIGIESKPIADPLRPGKTFYCAACHEPHRAATARLTRLGKDTADCRKCHRM